MGDAAVSRAVLVTGCSSGIGRASALALARAGWPVWASARDVGTIADLEAAGCRSLAVDVTDDRALAAAVASVESEHGAVGVLVNNAGYGLQGPIEETPLDAVRHQFETNVFAPWRLCQLVLPGMRRQGWGRIVNLSSMGGRLTFPGGGAYHGSKYAMEAISDVLRWEVAPFGVAVVAVEPGPTLTAYGEASLRSMAGVPVEGPYAAFTSSIRAALESTFRGDGLEGASTPEEVATAVVAALAADPPPARVVVGAMAEQLIALRQSSSEAEWDEIMATMYQRPIP